MVLVKVFQIRMSDRAIVFRFFDEQGNEIGSRGVNAGRDFDEGLFDEIVNNMTISDFYNYKTNGFVLPDQPSTALEQVAKIAYEQLMRAKQLEEAEKEAVVE